MKSAKRYFRLLSMMAFSLLIISCEDNDEITAEENEDLKEASSEDSEVLTAWIYEVMRNYYYWNEDIAPPASAEADPEDYFYSLLVPEDQFSFITDDYQELIDAFTGVYRTVGYSPTFGLLEANQVFIVVEYVYPGSPADRAGLRRGDIILEIDGQPMDTTNYFERYSQEQYTATLGDFTGTGIASTDRQVDLTAEVVATDPVLYTEVKEYGTTRVGYLVYTEFITGDNQQWLGSLDTALDEFGQESVEELIVDLRYNPGGEIEPAERLASAIAPPSAVASEEVLVRYEYNPGLEAAIEVTEGAESESLVSRLSDQGQNLNLDRVVFLTSSGTASASELLINGLEPYMDVIIVGEPTVGKFYGSWIIPDLEDSARHDWAVSPVVLKYANADGVTDFDDGLLPDYEIADNLLDAYPFGDEGDPVLAQALSLVTPDFNSRTLTVTDKVRPYQYLKNPENDQILTIPKPF